MSDQLPQGWTRATLDEIRAEDAPIIYGILQPGPDVDGGVPYVRPTEIVRDEIQVGQLRRTSNAIANKYQRATLRPGDLVFTIVGSIGKAGLVPPELAGANITQSSSRIRPKPSVVEPLYLKFALKSPGIAKQCEDFKLGTAVPRLNLEDVRKLEVSLAPLAEQQRIVAKLGTLLGKVDASQQRLAKIVVLLKRFRQAVLATACSGRLTADWRETASPKQLIPPSPANPDEIYEVEEAFDAATPWHWLPLQSLCDPDRSICYGVIKLGAEVPDGIPCLRTSDVKPLHIDTASVKRIAPTISDEYGRTLLRGGEVLVSVRGTLGGVAVVPGRLRGWNISREVAVVPLQDVIPKFVAFWIASLACQNWLTAVAKGVAYTGINIEDLKSLPVALPPLAEQEEIVRRVENLFALADRIEARFAEGRKRVDSITQAILAKAFRGELVPTEAELAIREGRSYESASELLDRIRASAAHSNNGAGSKARKTRSK
jgi:type I restriction enzyme S subunit